MRSYVLALDPDNLLRPYRQEAGLWSYSGSAGTTIGAVDGDDPSRWHWGWESPTSELRGHFLGHWLSAAASFGRDDGRVAAAAAHVVAELARCQAANGDGWVGPFPEKFLHRIAAGRPAWAPHYTIHKTFMGLLDMATVAGNDEALAITVRFADWFERWTASMSRDQLDDVLDWETGGMLEIWAELYSLTNDPAHLELVRRYDRPRFFDRLLAGEDPLTNKHANTQIPEILGAARAYEVTGDERWRRIVEAFWRCAVVDRGSYVTGGSTSAEIWQPGGEQSARLVDVQEHCTVYNMMRLADTLYRWTGDDAYAHYWEQNLVNGIHAQQHPDTGMVSYFLPLEAGATKRWGTPLSDFWCCHGSLVQAHARVLDAVVHRDDDGLRISQYIPSRSRVAMDCGTVDVVIDQDVLHGADGSGAASTAGRLDIQSVHTPDVPRHAPRRMVRTIRLRSESESATTICLRIPRWAGQDVEVDVEGGDVEARVDDAHVRVTGRWRALVIRLGFPIHLKTVPLPDEPDVFAFVDGPWVLAGLVEEERALSGDPADPTTMLTPHHERHHARWNNGHYRTVGQDRGFRFIPLSEVRDERYTVFFPIPPH